MNLQIFKLRSGEELICQVIEETKTKFKVSNPFIFKSSTMSDKHGSYDMTVLRDWLAQTNNKTVSIPKNHIVMQYEPKEDTKKLYELQLESEKTLEESIVSADSQQKMPTPAEENVFQDFLNAILQDAQQQMHSDDPWQDMHDFTPKGLSPRKRRKKQPVTEYEPGELDRHGIYVTMMIPSEAIMNLVTSGLLNPEDLLKMIKEVKKKNRFTGDEKKRGDFGNKFSDWNPDPGSDEYK